MHFDVFFLDALTQNKWRQLPIKKAVDKEKATIIKQGSLTLSYLSFSTLKLSLKCRKNKETCVFLKFQCQKNIK